jgi:hypothetical protein
MHPVHDVSAQIDGRKSKALKSDTTASPTDTQLNELACGVRTAVLKIARREDPSLTSSRGWQIKDA